MSYFNTRNNIIVVSGYNISVIGYEHASLLTSPYSFNLHNVLHAPKLIKNLVFVRKFAIDNDVFVEFDPFLGNIFQAGMHLMRCNNSDDLYPLTTIPYITTQPPSTFVALSNKVWNNRSGYPRSNVLNSLHRNNFITCYKFQNNFFCHSCPLGKQIKLRVC